MARVEQNVTFRNARIFSKNFKGEVSDKNPGGDRTFCVSIPDTDLADVMTKDGWPVKAGKVKEDGTTYDPYLPVKVSFKNKPPIIKLVSPSTGRKTEITEETVDSLDWTDFEKVDLTVNPYNWSVNGKSGVKAYLKTMYATIVEDELVSEYETAEELEPPEGEDDIPF